MGNWSLSDIPSHMTLQSNVYELRGAIAYEASVLPNQAGHFKCIMRRNDGLYEVFDGLKTNVTRIARRKKLNISLFIYTKSNVGLGTEIEIEVTPAAEHLNEANFGDNLIPPIAPRRIGLLRNGLAREMRNVPIGRGILVSIMNSCTFDCLAQIVATAIADYGSFADQTDKIFELGQELVKE